MNGSLIKFLSSQLFVCIGIFTTAQAVAYTDPAQAYNKLLIEKSNGRYVRVGNFKVTGSPYLFGDKQRGSVFAKNGLLTNTILSYNTYAQDIEIYLNEEASALVKPLEEVDSFYLSHAAEDGTFNLHFINASSLGFTDKSFVQIVFTGDKYSLYKKYKSNLEYVSTNYVQAELRQFDLVYEYYVYNVATKTFRKLKLTTNALKKEFGMLPEEITGESLSLHPEQTLVTLFAALN